jgi:hypothetical protein
MQNEKLLFLRLSGKAFAGEPMNVAELTYPGSRIDHSDAVLTHKAQTHLMMLELALADAAVALEQFSEALHVVLEPHTRQRDRMAAVAAERQKEREVFVEKHHRMPDFDEEAELSVEGDKRALAVLLESGQWPELYLCRLPFLYASAFLYALDRIAGFLKQLDGYQLYANVGYSAFDSFVTYFPGFRDLRNTAAHADERIDEFTSGKLLPDAVTTGGIRSSGVNLLFENLSGRRFGSTLRNGQYGEVDVSVESLFAARDVLQTAIEQIPWAGPAKVTPC